MKRRLQSFLMRSRDRAASTGQWFKDLWRGLRPKAGDFGSLRVCPSCGLITSRYKNLCLECGKSLKLAN